MRDCKAVRRTRIDLEHGVLDDVGRRWTTSKAGRAPAQVGRPHPVSTISALIVSRDKLADTRASFVHRSGGTLIGLVERVITNLSPQPISQPSWPGRSRCPRDFAQFWCGRPAMQVCLWTGSIALVTADPALPIGQVMPYRGSESRLGAISLGDGNRRSYARHPSSGSSLEVSFSAASEPRLRD